MPEFAIEVYLPRGEADGVRAAAQRMRGLSREGTRVRYGRSIFLSDDETCFHLLEAVSVEVAKEAGRRAALPVDRVQQVVDGVFTFATDREASPLADHLGVGCI